MCEKHKHHRFQLKKKVQRGPSSYDMQDPDTVFQALNLQRGDTFLDIGCGQGDYCLTAAKNVGSSGIVYAIDNWPNLTEGLQEDARRLKLDNIRTITADIREGLPIPNDQIDLCLLGTILHATTLDILQHGLASEMRRVLKPHGRVAVLECKKEEQLFGPTLERRLSAEQTKDAFQQHGFDVIDYVDLGYNYLLLFNDIGG